MADLSLKAQRQEAQRLVYVGKSDQALDLCRRILDAFPKHVATHGVYGQALMGIGEHEQAANVFRRVLSADPEDAVACATLGAIYDERGLVEEATWQMERAFELSPRNSEIRRALRALYARRGDPDTERVKMTRGALARIYLRGQLYPKAIGELRDIVRQSPVRFDLRVALAQALWWDRRDEDAAVVCQGILNELPNCLKPALILGQIWLNSKKDERARSLLQVCQALDPDNEVAQSLLGPRSPLPARVARLPVRDDDMPPLDLPYLLDDDSQMGDGRPQRGAIVDGQGMVVHSRRQMLEATLPAAPRGPEAESADASQGPRPESVGVSELQAARRWRDEGLVGTALDRYEDIIDRFPALRESLSQDLELLQALYPGSKRVQNLLQRLQETDS